MRAGNRLIIALLVGWLAQFAVVPHLAIGRAAPDVLLIVTATCAFLDGPIAGSMAGFAGGFLLDIVASRGTGVQVLARTLTGYFSGMLERTVFGSTVILVGATMFVLAVVSQLLYMVVAFIFGEAIEFALALRIVILPSALYTSIVSMMVFGRLSDFLRHERRETVFK